MDSTKRRVCGIDVTFQHHDKLHIDEATAIWLVERKADRKWLAKHAPTGVIMIGCGGGEFDDHATLTKPRTGKDTSATLVADSLGLRKHPSYRRLFGYLVEHDQGGVSYPFDAGSTVKTLHLKFSSAQILTWCYMVLDGEYALQRQYQDAMTAVQGAQIHAVSVGEKTLNVVVLNSDNEQVIKAARAPSIRAAVTVQGFTTGHIRIFIDRMAGLDMRPVAREIRRAEMKAQNIELDLDNAALEVEGEADHDAVRNWYFIHGALLNGSITNPNAKPTVLVINDVRDIVIQNLALQEQGTTV